MDIMLKWQLLGAQQRFGCKYNEKAIKYFKDESNNLDKFTYNKALQKMIESRRIEEFQKEELRRMKRK